MQNFGRFTIASYLPPAQPLTVDTGMNWEYIRIINNSPYLLSLDFSGMGKIDFPEMFLEDILIPRNYTGKITVTPIINLSNVSQAISSTVSINAWMSNELSTPQTQPLTQQAVNSTGSGKPLFSATVGFGSTVTKHQVLNVFNPANSGVTYTFYSARAFTSSNTAGVRAFTALSSGADLNLTNPVSAVSHAGKTNPPVSTAHCTSWDSDTLLTGTDIEDLNPATNVTEDFLAFPDTYTLFPGNNLRIVMDDPSAIGKVVRLTMKWSEDIVIPPVGGLPMGIATSVQQDGQPIGNPILEATPAGSSQTVLLTTDGKMVLSSSIQAGNLNTDSGNFTTDGAGNIFIGGSATLANGKVLQSKDSGGTLRTILVEDGANQVKLQAAGANNIILQDNAGNVLATIDGNGIHLNAGTLALLLGSLSKISKFTGTVSTTPTFFNHGLGVIPDHVIITLNGTSATAHSIFVDYPTMTTTQVKLTGDGANAFVGLAMKF